MEKVFSILYTHQKTKKAKTWQDGTLKVCTAQNRAILYDSKKSKLDALYIRLDQVCPGAELESDRYLIQVEEPLSDSASSAPTDTSSHAPPAQPSRSALVRRGGLLPRQPRYPDPTSRQQQAPPGPTSALPTGRGMGIKRKRGGFIPPRQLKVQRTDPNPPDDDAPTMTALQVLQANKSRLTSARSSEPFPPGQAARPSLFNMYARKNDASRENTPPRPQSLPTVDYNIATSGGNSDFEHEVNTWNRTGHEESPSANHPWVVVVEAASPTENKAITDRIEREGMYRIGEQKQTISVAQTQIRRNPNLSNLASDNPENQEDMEWQRDSVYSDINRTRPAENPTLPHAQNNSNIGVADDLLLSQGARGSLPVYDRVLSSMRAADGPSPWSTIGKKKTVSVNQNKSPLLGVQTTDVSHDSTVQNRAKQNVDNERMPLGLNTDLTNDGKESLTSTANRISSLNSKTLPVKDPMGLPRGAKRKPWQILALIGSGSVGEANAAVGESSLSTDITIGSLNHNQDGNIHDKESMNEEVCTLSRIYQDENSKNLANHEKGISDKNKEGLALDNAIEKSVAERDEHNVSPNYFLPGNYSDSSSQIPLTKDVPSNQDSPQTGHSTKTSIINLEGAEVSNDVSLSEDAQPCFELSFSPLSHASYSEQDEDSQGSPSTETNPSQLYKHGQPEQGELVDIPSRSMSGETPSDRLQEDNEKSLPPSVEYDSTEIDTESQSHNQTEIENLAATELNEGPSQPHVERLRDGSSSGKENVCNSTLLTSTSNPINSSSDNDPFCEQLDPGINTEEGEMKERDRVRRGEEEDGRVREGGEVDVKKDDVKYEQYKMEDDGVRNEERESSEIEARAQEGRVLAEMDGMDWEDVQWEGEENEELETGNNGGDKIMKKVCENEGGTGLKENTDLNRELPDNANIENISRNANSGGNGPQENVYEIDITKIEDFQRVMNKRNNIGEMVRNGGVGPQMLEGKEMEAEETGRTVSRGEPEESEMERNEFASRDVGVQEVKGGEDGSEGYTGGPQVSVGGSGSEQFNGEDLRGMGSGEVLGMDMTTQEWVDLDGSVVRAGIGDGLRRPTVADGEHGSSRRPARNRLQRGDGRTNPARQEANPTAQPPIHPDCDSGAAPARRMSLHAAQPRSVDQALINRAPLNDQKDARTMGASSAFVRSSAMTVADNSSGDGHPPAHGEQPTDTATANKTQIALRKGPQPGSEPPDMGSKPWGREPIENFINIEGPSVSQTVNTSADEAAMKESQSMLTSIISPSGSDGPCQNESEARLSLNKSSQPIDNSRHKNGERIVLGERTSHYTQGPTLPNGALSGPVRHIENDVKQNGGVNNGSPILSNRARLHLNDLEFSPEIPFMYSSGQCTSIQGDQMLGVGGPSRWTQEDAEIPVNVNEHLQDRTPQSPNPTPMSPQATNATHKAPKSIVAMVGDADGGAVETTGLGYKGSSQPTVSVSPTDLNDSETLVQVSESSHRLDSVMDNIIEGASHSCTDTSPGEHLNTGVTESDTWRNPTPADLSVDLNCDRAPIISDQSDICADITTKPVPQYAEWVSPSSPDTIPENIRQHYSHKLVLRNSEESISRKTASRVESDDEYSDMKRRFEMPHLTRDCSKPQSIGPFGDLDRVGVTLKEAVTLDIFKRDSTRQHIPHMTSLPVSMSPMTSLSTSMTSQPTSWSRRDATNNNDGATRDVQVGTTRVSSLPPGGRPGLPPQGHVNVPPSMSCQLSASQRPVTACTQGVRRDKPPLPDKVNSKLETYTVKGAVVSNTVRRDDRPINTRPSEPEPTVGPLTPIQHGYTGLGAVDDLSMYDFEDPNLLKPAVEETPFVFSPVQLQGQKNESPSQEVPAESLPSTGPWLMNRPALPMDVSPPDHPGFPLTPDIQSTLVTKPSNEAPDRAWLQKDNLIKHDGHRSEMMEHSQRDSRAAVKEKRAHKRKPLRCQPTNDPVVHTSYNTSVGVNETSIGAVHPPEKNLEYCESSQSFSASDPTTSTARPARGVGSVSRSPRVSGHMFRSSPAQVVPAEESPRGPPAESPRPLWMLPDSPGLSFLDSPLPPPSISRTSRLTIQHLPAQTDNNNEYSTAAVPQALRSGTYRPALNHQGSTINTRMTALRRATAGFQQRPLEQPTQSPLREAVMYDQPPEPLADEWLSTQESHSEVVSDLGGTPEQDCMMSYATNGASKWDAFREEDRETSVTHYHSRFSQPAPAPQEGTNNNQGSAALSQSSDLDGEWQQEFLGETDFPATNMPGSRTQSEILYQETTGTRKGPETQRLTKEPYKSEQAYPEDDDWHQEFLGDVSFSNVDFKEPNPQTTRIATTSNRTVRGQMTPMTSGSSNMSIQGRMTPRLSVQGSVNSNYSPELFSQCDDDEDDIMVDRTSTNNPSLTHPHPQSCSQTQYRSSSPGVTTSTSVVPEGITRVRHRGFRPPRPVGGSTVGQAVGGSSSLGMGGSGQGRYPSTSASNIRNAAFSTPALPHSSSKGDLQGELRFPAREDVETTVTPQRQAVIPASFSNANLYRQALTNALREHLNVLLFELSRRYHTALARVDTTDYDPGSGGGGRQTGAATSNNPVCKHGTPSKMVQVRKAGTNQGRFFFTCGGERNQQCGFFKWAEDASSTPGSSSGMTSALKISDGQSLTSFLRRSGINFYCECQLLQKDKQSMPAWMRKKMGMDDESTQKKLYLKLPRKEASSAYGKDDLWVLSSDLDFNPTHSMIARTTFYGPNQAMQLEIQPIGRYSPSNWPNGAFCHAIHVGNASSELGCMANVEETLLPSTLPILPHLLNSSEAGSAESASRGFNAPKMHEKTVFFVPGEIVDDIAAEMVAKYGLNEDQSAALLRIAAMFASARTQPQPPITLIHGVFGAGKSYLLAVVVLFLSRLFTENDAFTPDVPDPLKVLISSTTNVAVDRILLGLLELGHDDFVRVGSVKKIAKPILPYSVHATGSDNKELKDLQEMMKSQELTPSEKIHVRRSIEQYRKGANKKRLKSVRIVGVTCAACVFKCLQDFKFPVVLLDECSQMTEPMSLLPIAKFGCHKLVLVGDPKQLDPTIQGSEPCHDQGLEQTMFDRLLLMGHDAVMLRTQYRCHPLISAIPNKLFYDRQLRDGITSTDRLPLLEGWPSLSFLDVRDGCEKGMTSGSFYNDQEAELIVALIDRLTHAGVEPASIGVITLYKGQQARTAQLLNDSNSDMKGVQVSTVDAFQGGERDVIFLSCVRTHYVGFIDSDKRTNVALSRAKHHLFIVGHRKNLTNNPLWRKVIKHCLESPRGMQIGRDFLNSLETDSTGGGEPQSERIRSVLPPTPDVSLSGDSNATTGSVQGDTTIENTSPLPPMDMSPNNDFTVVAGTRRRGQRKKVHDISLSAFDDPQVGDLSDSDDDLPTYL